MTAILPVFLDEEEFECLRELLDAYLTPYGSHFMGIDNVCAKNILAKIEHKIDIFKMMKEKGDSECHQ